MLQRTKGEGKEIGRAENAAALRVGRVWQSCWPAYIIGALPGRLAALG
jgi:hypothetical protein